MENSLYINTMNKYYLNALKELTLVLRNKNIYNLESIYIPNDIYECIDFSNNNIIELTSLPKLSKVNTLLFSNNKIDSIKQDFLNNLPNLEALILTNNLISSLTFIDNISKCCKKIKNLCLIDNVVCNLLIYRLYVIYKLPTLKILDYRKIHQKERIEAEAIFKDISNTDLNKLMTMDYGQNSGYKFNRNNDILETKQNEDLELIENPTL